MDIGSVGCICAETILGSPLFAGKNHIDLHWDSSALFPSNLGSHSSSSSPMPTHRGTPNRSRPRLFLSRGSKALMPAQHHDSNDETNSAERSY
ncbi:mitogen activated protein kinase [Penicillium frequentans]|uniref:Mitogen activated protein kinase n=1 Tax=Penicillium frequentans TaxID=3151616 RepID=A0AAD6D3K9_9EURO|nr:mitogen activated protein kinase [Penicillium glabrum]